jgi:hypothetical protein
MHIMYVCINIWHSLRKEKYSRYQYVQFNHSKNEKKWICPLVGIEISCLVGTPKSFKLNKNQVEIFAKIVIQQTNKICQAVTISTLS